MPTTLPVSYSRSDPFPADEFALFENVPVFAEHETTARDGRKLRFTRDELQAVVERCNRRITDTGDYATVTVGHTPDPADVAQGKAQQPPVIGYAGPFKLGLLGQGDKQRYAILADFHIHNEDVDQMRRNPRRSPELWLEDDYKDMFLDPIALLGAQAPRLDMGLLYSASRNGKTVERYAAVAPGVGNVSLPSDDCLKEKMAKDSSGHEHDKRGRFASSQAKMESQRANNYTTGYEPLSESRRKEISEAHHLAARAHLRAAHANAHNESARQHHLAQAEHHKSISKSIIHKDKEKMAKDASGHEHDESGRFTSTGGGGSSDSSEVNHFEAVKKVIGEFKPGRQHIHGIPVVIHDGEPTHEIRMTGVDRDATTDLVKHLRRKGLRVTRHSDTDFEVGKMQQADHYSRNARQLFQRYSLNTFISSLRSSAMALSQDDIKQLLDAMEQLDWVQWCKSQMAGAAPEPDADDLGGAPPPPAADGGTPEKFGKEDDDDDTDDVDDAEKYARQNRALVEKYDRLNGQVAALAKTNERLTADLAKERNQRVRAERYQRLDKVRQTRAFDLDDEVKKCDPAKMTDEQFKDRVDFIEKYGKEVVADREPPVPEDEGVTIGAHAPGEGQRTERYSKAQRDSAFDRAKARALKGETGNLYEEELAKGK